MIVEFDDFHDGNHRLDLLQELKASNPAFRCTVFAIPAKCSSEFLAQLPDWIEIAVHGDEHGDPPTDGGECRSWSRERMETLMGDIKTRIHLGDRFVAGFKAPGWQISAGCYEALQPAGWWVADHYDQDDRRPTGLRTHRLSPTASSGADPEHWHGHIQDVCGNGLEETFGRLVEMISNAASFELISEAVTPWQ